MKPMQMGKPDIFDAALYLRLSKDDMEGGRTTAESNSIANQRELLRSFVKSHTDIQRRPSLKRNHILFLPPKDSAKAPGAGNNQMGDAAVFRIELQIAHKAQLFTVTDVDDFFFFKSKIRIDHIRNETSLL